MIDAKTLEAIREINRNLPFAHPIAESTTSGVWFIPAGFNPAAPLASDFERAVHVGEVDFDD